MNGCLLRSVLLLGTQLPAAPLSIPCRQVFRVGQAREEFFYIVIRLGIKRDGVVEVVARLLPRVEHDVLIRMVGMKCCNDPLDWVVEQDWAHTHLVAKLEIVRVIKERLILADGFALVVENRPAAADPARINHRITLDHRTWFRLNFLLDLTPKTVGITQTDLDFGRLTLLQITDMGLTRQSGSKRRLSGALITVKIIDNPRRRFAQQGGCLSARIHPKSLQLRERWIGVEVFQKVAEHLRGLALHGSCNH